MDGIEKKITVYISKCCTMTWKISSACLVWSCVFVCVCLSKERETKKKSFPQSSSLIFFSQFHSPKCLFWLSPSSAVLWFSHSDFQPIPPYITIFFFFFFLFLFLIIFQKKFRRLDSFIFFRKNPRDKNKMNHRIHHLHASSNPSILLTSYCAHPILLSFKRAPLVFICSSSLIFFFFLIKQKKKERFKSLSVLMLSPSENILSLSWICLFLFVFFFFCLNKIIITNLFWIKFLFVSVGLLKAEKWRREEKKK